MARPSRPERLTPKLTSQFKKDFKRQQKRGKDMDKLATVIETLCSRKELEPRHRDHALTGDWKNWRDCHIEPDWLLLYSTTGVQLILARTGTHSEIFG